MKNLFVCYGWDIPEQLSTRMAHRQAHLERVKQLDAAGRIFVGGPLLVGEDSDPVAAGFAGSLIIANFPNLAEAKQWWDSDPYVQNGLFREWGVRPYLAAFPQAAK